jgi:hypothetical protein
MRSTIILFTCNITHFLLIVIPLFGAVCGRISWSNRSMCQDLHSGIICISWSAGHALILSADSGNWKQPVARWHDEGRGSVRDLLTFSTSEVSRPRQALRTWYSKCQEEAQGRSGSNLEKFGQVDKICGRAEFSPFHNNMI